MSGEPSLGGRTRPDRGRRRPRTSRWRHVAVVRLSSATRSARIGHDARPPLAVLDHQDATAQIDVRHAQPHRLTQPHPGAVQHQDRARAASRPRCSGLGGRVAAVEQATHLIVAEDVGHEHRLLDRRHRVLGNEARRIAATPEQAELAHDAELVAHRDGLAPRDARRPARHGLVERRRRVRPVLVRTKRTKPLRTNSARR